MEYNLRSIYRVAWALGCYEETEEERESAVEDFAPLLRLSTIHLRQMALIGLGEINEGSGEISLVFARRGELSGVRWRSNGMRLFAPAARTCPKKKCSEV